jgi:hypothetical protein
MGDTTTSTLTGSRTRSCDGADALTRSLLGYGVIAGPLYVAVSLAQAFTREGFDITRHAWSLLANGDLGFAQIANLILTGAMTVAFAYGWARWNQRRRAAPGASWAPRLVGAYGGSLVIAGIFRADPALGFPVGTPADAQNVSWHGVVHLAAGGVGFLCLVAACLLSARQLRSEGARGWAIATRTTGIVFLAAFVGIVTGAGTVITTLAFVTAVVGVCGWMSAFANRLYRAAA